MIVSTIIFSNIIDIPHYNNDKILTSGFIIVIKFQIGDIYYEDKGENNVEK